MGPLQQRLLLMQDARTMHLHALERLGKGLPMPIFVVPQSLVLSHAIRTSSNSCSERLFRRSSRSGSFPCLSDLALVELPLRTLASTRRQWAPPLSVDRSQLREMSYVSSKLRELRGDNHDEAGGRSGGLPDPS